MAAASVGPKGDVVALFGGVDGSTFFNDVVIFREQVSHSSKIE
jgi:hypothetical protein